VLVGVRRYSSTHMAGEPFALRVDFNSPEVQEAMMCCLYGGGIIVMLGIYGVIQERVMAVPYDGDMFKASVFLVLCNRLWGVLYAVTMATAKGEELSPKAPLWKYVAISFSNVAATTCQYEALKYVSFPVQMLGKSFKMMPVMVWSILISGKKYKAQDWAIAAAVTWGVTQFLLTGSISSKHGDDKGNSVYGLLLLAGFLGCDGFTSTFQEKLFKDHKTSKFNQMMYVNMSSAVVSFGSLVFAGMLSQAIQFCLKHPMLFVHAMALSASAVAAQYFIYSLVADFGALVFAVTMNLRQVISMTISYLMYGHVISLLQFLGLVLVFGALFYKSYMGFKKSQESKATPPHQPVPTDDIELPKQPEGVVIGHSGSSRDEA